MARCVTGRNSKSLVHCGSGINCYRQFLSLFGVPPHICRHSEQVAHLACFLSESIRDHTGQNLNSALIAGAALLHDIAKVSCIGTSRDHAKEGGEILRSFGLEEMASLVERHIDAGLNKRITHWTWASVRHPTILMQTGRTGHYPRYDHRR